MTKLEPFYGSIPIFRGFARLMDPSLYRRLPDDWTVGVSDIVDSTKAIAADRYKAVNIAGAAVIEAHPKFTDEDSPAKSATPERSEWKPFIRDFNVWVERRATGEKFSLSTDGTKDNAYRQPILIQPFLVERY